MYHVLVTGGAGYVGSVLVPALLTAGYRVTVLDSFAFGQATLLDCCHDERFAVVRGDVRDEALVRRLLSGVDAVIPLAALVGAPLCDRDPVGAVTVNRDAVTALVKWASRDQRILLPVTNSGYGIGGKDEWCTEESPLTPVSLYGRTKVEAERAVLDRGNCVTFRLATVFGTSPRMRIDLLVNDFVYRAVTDRFLVVFEGHFRRNFLHVRDVARAFLHGLEHFETMKDTPYNVGLSDANLTKLELCARIRAELPEFVYLEAPIGEDRDKRDYLVSNAKIEATGYRPRYSLEDGIRELVKGYRMVTNTRYGNV